MFETQKEWETENSASAEEVPKSLAYDLFARTCTYIEEKRECLRHHDVSYLTSLQGSQDQKSVL
jgi:hypothetical protein